jgi:phosphoserine phosphatase RsbU/P
MADADWQPEIKRLLAQIETLRNRLTRQKMHMSSMMLITQAINENVGAQALYASLSYSLNFEMQIKRHCLLYNDKGRWEPVSHAGVSLEYLNLDTISTDLSELGPGRRRLERDDHLFMSQFSYGLPVMHKNTPLAYLFIGDLQADNDDQERMALFDSVTAFTNIIIMAIENKRLFKEQMSQKIMESELEFASKIQQMLIPDQLPNGALYELSGIYQPHYKVGGDYYDVVELPDGKLAFCIADISGKGMAAALLMANFQAIFYSLITRPLTLEEIIQEMSRSVHRVTKGDRFITVFLAKYEPATRTLHYINAGHTPPFLLMGDEVHRLQNGTMIIGYEPELPFVEIGGICLTEPAILFSYTDGLTDLRNPFDQTFDDDLLEAYLRENAHLPAKELNTRLLHHIETFRDTEPYPDDVTVLTCRMFY